MTISVLLVDDHPVVRSGLRAVLDGETVRVVGETGTGEDAVALATELRPDVVLCDLRLGDGIDGIETTARLCTLDPAPAVLMLTTFDRDVEVLGAIEAGATGYLLKDSTPDEIVAGIVRAADGGMVLSPGLSARLIEGMRSPRPRLTERETEVLQHLAAGESNREIAQNLFVSEATVKSHLVHIFTKLDVDNRARAVHVARELGLM